jgi:hypothetical protein
MSSKDQRTEVPHGIRNYISAVKQDYSTAPERIPFFIYVNDQQVVWI